MYVKCICTCTCTVDRGIFACRNLHVLNFHVFNFRRAAQRSKLNTGEHFFAANY